MEGLKAVSISKQSAPASGVLQRKCSGCKKKEKEKAHLQRSAVRSGPVGEVPPIVHEVLRSPGRPLDAETRAFMEPRFGQDFSRVRPHAAPQAAGLTIGPANDSYEQEADRVAEQVMRIPVHTLQRACEPCETGRRPRSKCIDENVSTLHRRAASPSALESAEVADTFLPYLGSGRPLDTAIRAFVEPRLGQDFGMVRVHADAGAARSAQAVNALAYTVGRGVVFGAGQYESGTESGRKLIAHELVHVIQQTHGRTVGKIQRTSGDAAGEKALNIQSRKGQPYIWFDDWKIDRRDNDADGFIDSGKELVGTYDGAHFTNFDLNSPHNKHPNICRDPKKYLSSGPNWSCPCCPQDNDRELAVDVQYFVCLDIPNMAYKDAGLTLPGGQSHWVPTAISGIRAAAHAGIWQIVWDHIQNKTEYPDTSTLQKGDFVAHDGHSGIAYGNQEVIHLPGPSRPISDGCEGGCGPSAHNDVRKDPRKGFFGIHFVARLKEKGGGGKTTCIPIEAPPMLSSPAHTAQNRLEVSEASMLGSDLIGLSYNDGIDYGTWDRRSRVKRLQGKLNEHGSALKTDGMFGVGTAAALQQFQATMGLPEKDTVDPATADALDTYVPDPDHPSAVSRIEGLRVNDGITYGTWDRRPRVGELQQRLTGAGFPCKVDGMFGPETTEKLHGYQVTQSLAPNDKVDRATADALEGRTRGGEPPCPAGQIPVEI